MTLSVRHGHLPLYTGEEHVELDVEPLEQQGQGRDRWDRSASLEGADVRAAERAPELGLSHRRDPASTPQLGSDRAGEIVPVLVLQNN
jgi:hypothetical protein